MRNSKVLSLLVRKLAELHTKVVEVKTSDSLVKDLGENVDTNGERTGLGKLNVLAAELLVVSVEQSNLSKDLVGERARHDKRGVAGGASQVDKTSLSKEDNVATAGHSVSVDLGLDVDDRLGVGLEPGDINLNVKVTNVADNSVVGHLGEVLTSDNVSASGGCDKDLANLGGLLHRKNLETRNSSLEGVDGVDLGDNDTSTHRLESHNTALSDITVSGNDSGLTSNHNVGGTLDTIDKGLTASVEVVKLALGNRVVDVDGRDLELALLHHSIEVVDTSGGLLRESKASLEHLGVLLVNKGGKISTIVQDEVEGLSVLEGLELLLDTPEVLLLGLTLPGKDGDSSSSNSGGGVILSGEDVAGRPGNLSTKSNKGLNEDSGLNGHVQASSDTGALERLNISVLLAGLHKTRHFILGELNLLAAEGGKGDVGDFVRNRGSHF